MQARNLRPEPARPYRFSLHIRHPSLHPSEISRELQWQADESFAAGAPRQSLGALVAAPLHSESYWAAALEASFWSVSYAGEPAASVEEEGAERAPPLALRRGMSELLSRLARSADVNVALEMLSVRLAHHAALFRDIRSAGGSVALIAMLPAMGQLALRLTPEVCRRLADLGITLRYEFAGSEY